MRCMPPRLRRLTGRTYGMWVIERRLIEGPKPLVTVDIFRVKNGKLVEHCDVMQEDVPASKTKSGRPLFPTAP